MGGTLTFVVFGAGLKALTLGNERCRSALISALTSATLTLPLTSRPAAAQDPSQTVTTLNVTGRVVNALTGAAIPRALVNMNSRTVLTDSLGHFSFPEFQPNGSSSEIQAYATVTKPGYASGVDSGEGGSQQITDLSGPVELKLYPDGLILGTVTGSDGEPLERMQISISREMGDEASRRLQQVGFTMTDSHGEYRLEEPPGRYSLLLRYSPRGGDAEKAVLPQRYPPETGENTIASFQLNPGDQPKIDLRARTGTAYPVTFRVETSSGQGQNIRIFVRSSTGESFSVFAQPSGTPGEFRVQLPSGSYSLHAVQQSRDRTLEAESSITVAGHAATGFTLHFVDVSSIPIHVLLDTTTAGVDPSQDFQYVSPTPMNLNLHFQKIGALDEDGSGQLRVSILPDKSFAIIASTGTYHLTASPGAQWYIKQATYGPLNLFTHNLTVTAGAGGEPIRMVVSSSFGEITGTLRKNGVGAGGYVYLLPHETSLVPVYTVRTARDGSYSQRVPPGIYTVVAFDHRLSEDLKDPVVRTQVDHGGATAEVTAGGQTTIDLDQQTLEKAE